MTVAGWDRRATGLCLLAMAWLVLTLGIRPLAVPDEGRYVSAAWEMLVSGNWLYPTLNGLPFFDKPPLFYWITAGSLALFSTHEWAARLASVAGAGVAAFTLYGFALRQGGRRLARWALLILVTQPLFFGAAQFASIDMLVAGLISAATLLAAEAAINVSTEKPHRMLLTGAYACAAFGVLAKGLIGAVLPGLVIVLWLAWCRRPALLLKLIWLPGLALFTLIGLPWFVAMQAYYPGYFRYFFVYQQFQRFAEGGFNNPQPFWFYLPVLLAGLLPWTLLFPTAIRQHSSMRDRSPGVRQLMWIWAAAIVVFFSIPASKMLGYVLPAVPPLAYLLALGLDRKFVDAVQTPRPMTLFATIGGLLCLSAVLASAVLDHRSSRALSGQIAAQRQPEEPVFFVGYQFYDLPFYLKLREPVRIVEDWVRPGKRRTDNWRTALVEAGRFEPERAAQLLLDREQFEPALCESRTSWVIARKGATKGFGFLEGTPPTATQGDRAAWKILAADLRARGFCRQTPTGGSPGTSGQPPPPG